MHKQRLVLVGNGMAGLRCIENILKEDDTLYDITIFGTEPHANYSRIMLSSVLQGDTTFDDITINDWNWYKENKITLYTNETVIDINKDKKTIKTDKNHEVNYDKLILATGSDPIILPLPGIDKEGVLSFRTIQDCQAMMEASRHYQKAVVIGGGLLGLEAARGLLNLGMKVDVVHLADFLMNKQLDPTAATMLQTELENQGMHFLLEKVSKEIVGEKRVEGLRFSDGSIVETDLVVMAVGVKPNIKLAKEAGIDTNRGILVNDFLETKVEDIYAVGECAEHNEMVYGLVKPLYEQGVVLAKYLCNKLTAGYEGSTLSTQLKISGVDVFSVGDFTKNEETKAIQYHDEIASTYKKVFFKDNKVVGAVLFGDTSEASRILDVIVKKKFIPDDKKQVLLQPQDISTSYAATLPRADYVCTCNSVSKGAIIDCVLKKNLTTVQEVKTCTKASSSCGGCKPVVSELLTFIQSDHFHETSAPTNFCGCTDLSENEMVAAIQKYKLTSTHEVMQKLEWKDLDGCEKCLPALEYYIGMIYPEYDKHQATLYVNEKMNALVGEDETYSVVPQLYGGLVETDHLQKIVEVARKYNITTLSLSSDQRLHLSRIAKADFLSFCKDLDMPLHSVSANMVQSVKTTNSNQYCSCDKEPAIALASMLERKTEFIKVPYRIRMGVSACLHNGAGSTTKDIGAIKINRGWEVYIGGSSGRNVRTGQLLTVASTAEEVLQLTLGFIQYYRESAHYLERTWEWINRVSMVHLREVLFNEELLHYLVESLKKDSNQRMHVVVKS
ncbi:nitrite reductase large subunit NirB [Saliterribacillus persicus]|uniref:Nitrite reductase (NADH) large subunit n=1 Tax=Saliterribacillus persicus TaxID=930114 RepID=A0A368X7G3_9BACI|nr:nitrite reductase large subunit NirB [Saliterribacillus persicus]RCW63893.1 nitrite reductase (NADH) large subunit [Saliterribacillus persicus]